MWYSRSSFSVSFGVFVEYILMTNTGIPGLTFSWKRAVGIQRLRTRIARKTGIPTTMNGIYRKLGRMLLKILF